ncbi:Fur family transcriptional regulator [Puniceicoccus vermicola]|uniref:Transcriptional repressor n=1 Tax=Puniceicoccus vermicola TaxID=388746 RepID=A0A7X1E5B2_9BACT|nr:Fur family transcriptional regulator [Puniceicoccus vermicola]MBC2603485.1 transcriptional repressor [Puniceicoccus vermicola]
MGQSTDNLKKAVTERLQSSSLRITKKRRRILEALLNFDRPETAVEIREGASLPESDLVTVYRTMEAFESIGILQKVPLENGGHLFELIVPGDHHHHFVCRECHKAERLEMCLFTELEKRAKTLGFAKVAHVMEVYGLCPKCQ